MSDILNLINLGEIKIEVAGSKVTIRINRDRLIKMVLARSGLDQKGIEYFFDKDDLVLSIPVEVYAEEVIKKKNIPGLL